MIFSDSLLKHRVEFIKGDLKFVPDTNSWLPAKLFLANLKDFEATTLQPEVWSPSHCIVKLVLTISTDYVLSANFVNYVNCFNRCRCAIITRSWQSLFVFGFNFAAVSCYIIFVISCNIAPIRCFKLLSDLCARSQKQRVDIIRNLHCAQICVL